MDGSVGVGGRGPLDEERKGAEMDVDAVMALLAGSPEVVEKRRQIRRVIEADEVMSVDDYYFCDRTRRYERALEKTVRFVQLVRMHGWKDQDAIYARRCIREQLPVGLHWAMFIPCIKGQGTKEQQAKWLPLAETMQIVGTYAQTELGHGTFLRGLETTATYDPATESFILNSPTLTSTKWWPGSLGKTATHCVVMARLITKGRDYGTHAFIVQIRDLDTHRPLKGITVGDIGPKFGYDSMDNGFLRFDSVAIPRAHLLSRYAKVAVDGSYSKPLNTKLSYGTMIFVRSHMIMDAALHLKAATTIAVRYGAVRRQSLMDETDTTESKILDYTVQQETLFELLGAAFAFHFAGRILSDLYHRLQASLSSNDLSLLSYTHGTTSGLKAYCSTITSEGIEACRRCCGGHGYSKFSGLPDLYTDYVPACTYEGENVVMYLQCARYLLKMVAAIEQKDPVPSDLAYLGDRSLAAAARKLTSTHGVKNLDNLLLILRAIAVVRIMEAHGALISAQQRYATSGRAWNACAPVLMKAAQAHCRIMVFNYLLEGVRAAHLDDKTHGVLVSLTRFYGLRLASYDVVETDVLTRQAIANMKQAAEDERTVIRRNAVALVDAFDLSDFFLNSALGRADGRVYEALYEYAQKEPMNQHEVSPAVEQHLLPLMQTTRRIFGGQSKL
ncbi:hypothetical protein PTSG_00839 [Salpingoeca rosetta]|uniref:Acyl-coenzyme A oxidase n=1 Tax=Salpingoeca rosetta (strain ATCC 50818 / BSB-021) TaxID=946362 RepID=F2TXM3_SALR5|nr:uncharacterized protein PTSG_00839 [Salpingoeca rosetta]EGD76132.1 hypothetical protein PTSG_00839 [Salpingoeca rosetta]|eukprot:XP_004998307.1 hypothetical protein PTSG_00839 [Salpingoeca rosetta]